MIRTAIVAVHGVTPQIRYGFQDDVAQSLRDALNVYAGTPGTWKMGVVFPKQTSSISTDPTDIATISRVYQAADTIESPTKDYFDVHEAYWSPIDKGKTNAASIGYWLLRTLFLPINNTARFMEATKKVAFDITYVLVAAILAITLLIGSATLLVWSIQSAAILAAAPCQSSLEKPLSIRGTFVPSAPEHASPGTFSAKTTPDCVPLEKPTLNPISAFSAALKPLTLIAPLPSLARVVLILGAIGAYLLAQVLRAIYSLIKNSTALSADPVQRTSRIRAIVGLLIISGALLLPFWLAQMPSAKTLGLIALVVVVAASLFQGARSILSGFFVAFFGDVQIYTTRDQNSDFYNLRETILEIVASKIRYVLAADPVGTPYDRVHVFAHSLGSSISMDAILRLYNRRPDDKPLDTAWSNLRSFVTFGTSLEKTKYFFNAWSPTPSQEWSQWSDAIYGSLFTKDRSILLAANTPGIYWLNSWYFTDFVADSIGTYRSFGRVGYAPSDSLVGRAHAKEMASHTHLEYAGRVVAENRTTRGPLVPRGWCIQTHTHYLDRDWFWKQSNAQDIGALDVLLVGTALPPNATIPPPPAPPVGAPTPPPAPTNPAALYRFSLTSRIPHAALVQDQGFHFDARKPGTDGNFRTVDIVK